MNVDLYKYQSRNPLIVYLMNNYFQVVGELYNQVKKESRSIIEIGCGEGFSTQRISKFIDPEISLEACDICQPSLEIAADNCPGSRVFRASVEDLYQQKTSYDLVFLLEVLEHLDKPQMVLERLREVCKQYLILGVPNEPIWRVCNMLRLKYLSDWGNTPGHINFWNLKSLTKLVERNFGPVLVCRCPFPWIIILAKNSKYEINNSDPLF